MVVIQKRRESPDQPDPYTVYSTISGTIRAPLRYGYGYWGPYWPYAPYGLNERTSWDPRFPQPYPLATGGGPPPPVDVMMTVPPPADVRYS